MKKSTLFIALFALSAAANAQMEVDSSLIVSDTLTVQDDARIGHNLEVEEDAIIKKDLEVDGATELHDVVIHGTTWMPSLQPFDNTEFGILVSKNDGTLMKAGPGNLFPVPPVPIDPLGFCDLAGNPYGQNPYWVSGPQKLYTACPEVFVGVGTNTPLHQFHVRGNSFTSGIAGIGAEPNPDAQLNTLTSRKVGICVDHNYGVGFGYAFKAITNNDETKGIGIFNNGLSTDVFTVFGSGKTLIGNPSFTTGMVNVSSNLKYGLTIDQNSTEQDNTALQLMVAGDTENYAFRIHDKVSQKDVFRIYNNGKIYSTEINVAIKDDFPDYVFKSDYKLMPLNELELYISENGHLPNLQPATYYEENGINTSEMHVLEVEKIEELTLYLLELQKEVEELKAQLNECTNF